MFLVPRQALLALIISVCLITVSPTARAFDTNTLKISAVDPGSGKLKKVVATGLILAPPNKVWKAVTDYAAYSKFMPKVVSSKLNSRVGNTAVATMILHLPFPFKEIVYTNNYIEQPDIMKMEWALIKSNKLKSNVGGWSLKAKGKYTEGTYTVIVDPGVPMLPKWMIETATKSTIPQIFSQVEKFANSH